MFLQEYCDAQVAEFLEAISKCGPARAGWLDKTTSIGTFQPPPFCDCGKCGLLKKEMKLVASNINDKYITAILKQNAPPFNSNFVNAKNFRV